MWLTRWIGMLRYSGYDRGGNAKYLLGRVADPAQLGVAGVPPELRDLALAALCESFDIPRRQMHCFRADDALMALYRSLLGPRNWDNLEFTRLWYALEDAVGAKLPPAEFEAIQTVGDVVRAVAVGQGATAKGAGATSNERSRESG